MIKEILKLLIQNIFGLLKLVMCVICGAVFMFTIIAAAPVIAGAIMYDGKCIKLASDLLLIYVLTFIISGSLTKVIVIQNNMINKVIQFFKYSGKLSAGAGGTLLLAVALFKIVSLGSGIAIGSYVLLLSTLLIVYSLFTTIIKEIK
jgi:hypothetical protein